MSATGSASEDEGTSETRKNEEEIVPEEEREMQEILAASALYKSELELTRMNKSEWKFAHRWKISDGKPGLHGTVDQRTNIRIRTSRRWMKRTSLNWDDLATARWPACGQDEVAALAAMYCFFYSNT
ncbi:hypothetical protein R1flu_017837 [Riccia fluitans]|uniref:Uncharacterized protein n=1 Tax=Riccia fluitans TaxID=41844 RepID=A0ABD1ZE42_9MARC